MRGVFGMRGEITTDWNYNSSLTYGLTRANYNRAVRVPNLAELYKPPRTRRSAGFIICV